MDEIKNRGVILGSRDTDWIAGETSKIVYKEENPSGDWTAYLPDGEWQYNPIGFDALACVTFSSLNVLETLYFFKTGTKRNFSDRFTAYMSGTTHEGNFTWKVGDSIRNDGLVDEADWRFPDNPTWDTYYAAPTIDVINKAKDFLKDWQVNYEIIDFTRESLIYHLKQAPIQVILPGHAVMLFATTEQVYRYFDSYGNPSFVKERSEPFIYAQKYVLTKKTIMKTVQPVGDNRVYAEDSDGNLYWITSDRMLAMGIKNGIFLAPITTTVIDSKKVIGTFNKEY